MDSHYLKSLLSGMLVDTGVQFEHLQQHAGQPDIDSDAEETTFAGGLQNTEEEEAEVDNTFNIPFANDFFLGGGGDCGPSPHRLSGTQSQV
jgi:hypothetical protein